MYMRGKFLIRLHQKSAAICAGKQKVVSFLVDIICGTSHQHMGIKINAVLSV